jgi:peptide/nickel transport system ATP-binding protein
MPVLAISDLKVDIHGNTVLHDIDLTLEPGRILGVVGESGSGKSMTALSVMQLLPHGSQWSGSIRVAGTDLAGLDEPALCRMRGRDVGMIFQEPMTALNPVRTIGDQVAETVRIHTGASRREAFSIAREMLDRVGLPEDRFPLDRFPHDLSGGQRQRVVIAQAIALRPRLLIADEPTTALDVTTQAQILDLLKQLVREEDMGLMLITHDLAVVAGLADSIAIMKDGAVVEAGPTREDLSGDAPSLHASPVFGFRPCARARSKARTRHHAGLGGRECRPRLPAAAPQPVCQTRRRSAPSTM